MIVTKDFLRNIEEADRILLIKQKAKTTRTCIQAVLRVAINSARARAVRVPTAPKSDITDCLPFMA